MFFFFSVKILLIVKGMSHNNKVGTIQCFVSLCLSGAAPLDYGNAPPELSRIIYSILGLFCA